MEPLYDSKVELLGWIRPGAHISGHLHDLGRLHRQ